MSLSPSEWKTRRSLIDPKLNAAGWAVAAKDAVDATIPHGTITLTEYPTTNGPADYAFCNGGRIIGIVEAKKLAVSSAGVLTQAQRYAEGVQNSPFDFRGQQARTLESIVKHFNLLYMMQSPVRCVIKPRSRCYE